MSVFALRARSAHESRLPVVMALVFNGLSFIASVLAVLSGDLQWVVFVIGAASLFVTVTSILSLQAGGKLMMASSKAQAM